MKEELRKKNELYTIYDLQVGEYVLSVTYLNPEQQTIGHLHNYPEGYYFTAGIGRLEVGRRKKRVSAGQFIYIPANRFHRVINGGVMSMIFVCVFKREV